MKTRLVLALFAFAMQANAQNATAGKFSGYMFGEYFTNARHDTTAVIPNAAVGAGGRDYNAFQLRRIYFTYDNDISQSFTTRFRMESTTGAPFIKDAYLKWKNVFAGSDLYFGLQPTPAYDVSETAWSYRALEKTIMDLRGIVSSRDLGLALRGRIDAGGIFGYWIMAGNNSGTNNETDRYKRFYAHMQIKPSENLLVTLYADYGMKADINNAASTSVPKSTLNNDDLTTAAFIGYGVKDSYMLGAEAFYKTTANGNLASTLPSVTYASRPALGVSVWGWINFAPEWAAVVRYDYFDPNSDSAFKGDVRNYVLAALNWKADKNVWIMPNLQYETYESLPAGGRSFDPSITARVTFYYVFL